MVIVGYHASHEQYTPGELLECVQAAERSGFTAAMCSDHFFPWSETQGQSGFAWSWLGAAMQATSLSFGVVNAPGYRYHPAIIAQAAATLQQMFPDRFWIAVGSGEAMNEHITGERWPIKAERNARLKECVDVMRALWAGETVNHVGHVIVQDARLYTRPTNPPPIIGAALSPETAEWMASWVDGLVTINGPRGRVRVIVKAFRRGGGEGKPMTLQVHLAWGESEDHIRHESWEQWRAASFSSSVLADLRMPEQFDAIATRVRPGDIDESVRISTDIEQHIAWLQEDIEMGFERIYLHNVPRNQREFIEAFGERVVPVLKDQGVEDSVGSAEQAASR